MALATPLFRVIVVAALAAMAVAPAPAVTAAAAAAACTCASPPPLVDSVAAVPHTLVARVTDLFQSPVPVKGEVGERVYAATVGTSFFGCTQRRILLSTVEPDPVEGVRGCAATLTIGKKYLLMLSDADDKGTYRVTACGPQRLWEEVGAADRHMLWRVNGMVCPRPRRIAFNGKR
ncbi:hypothetical protein MMPV_009956 [Pyropia vietnamensis]